MFLKTFVAISHIWFCHYADTLQPIYCNNKRQWKFNHPYMFTLINSIDIIQKVDIIKAII